MPSALHEQAVATMLANPSTLQAPTVAEQRAGMEAGFGNAALAADVHVSEVIAGGVPADWLALPDSSATHAVLYLHGGGYVLGSRATHRELASRVARASGARVLLIDYRLAPEHPFPAAVEDAVAAYRWLLSEGYSAERLAIAGDSAGGGLTFATLLALKQQSLALPACAATMSPWVDLEGTGASAQPGGADDPMITLPMLQTMGRHYAGNDLRNPLAAPLYGDLSGLPPLLIQVGTRELLLDDSTRIATRAWQAGVSVELQVQAGLIHVWQLMPFLPESAAALRAIGDFLRRHWDRNGGG